MSKIILHIDLNKFFVRCEEIKNPSLIGKPVIIGGDGRKGIVSTCSYEARDFGVHSGMPTFIAKQLCPQAIIIDCDFKFISLLSKEFHHYIKGFTTKIEQASLDECFCDITEYYEKYGNGDIMSVLKKIQNGLLKQTQLKCSIGVAPTKFLAKMGSDYKKPMGITIIRKKDIPNILFPLDVGDFYGIGKKTAPRLHKIGVKTIGDLYNGLKENNTDVLELIGNGKDHIIRCLEGYSSSDINTEIEDPKSIGRSYTLNADTTDKEVLKKALHFQINDVVNQLVQNKLLAKTIQITYKDASCQNHFKASTFSKTFDQLTDDLDYIMNETFKFFDTIRIINDVRLIGFTLKNLSKKEDAIIQLTLENYSEQKDDETKKIIDKLNKTLEKPLFFKGSDLKKK